MGNPAFPASRRLYEMTEYSLDYSSPSTSGTDRRHERVRSSYAWARGATGAGETVVLADSGFFTEHEEFGGTGKFTLGATFGTPCTPAELVARTCSDDHGTGTAGVAAARRGNGGATTSGVAFDANIIGLRVRLGGGGQTRLLLGPRTLTDANDRENVAFYERLLYRPAAGGGYDRDTPWGFVINFSFGRPHGVDSYTREQVRENRDRTAALFKQADLDAADRTIIVWAAGNRNGDRYDLDLDGDGELDLGEIDAGGPVDATSPTLETALGVHFPELQGHVLTVVAIDQRSGEIASFSNRCGTAKGFCLAAPGTHMVLARRGACSVSSSGGGSCASRYWVRQGTSYAAPMVTGALAVMRQFFRNPPGSPDAGEPALGNTELVTRLLATADRTDYSASVGADYSDSDTYGHGMLDLDAATRPVGTLMVASADGGRTPLDSTSLDLTGGAFGGQVSRQLRNVPLALFDELDSPFFFPADRLVNEGTPAADELAASDAATAADRMLLRAGNGDSHWWFAPEYNSGAPLAGLAAGGGGWANFGRGDALAGGRHDARGAGKPAFLAPHAFTAPYFSLVRHGSGAGFSTSAPNRGRFGMAVMHGAARPGSGAADDWRRGTAVAFDFRPRAAGRRAFHLQAGLVREGEGFLGARPSGAMGTARGETLFAGAGLAWDAGRHWRAHASGYVGRTRPNASPGLLGGVSDLRSSAFSVGLMRHSAWRRGDWLGLRLSQPLRVESGRARLRLATARSRYGVVRYDDLEVDLQPRARALEAEVAWRAPPASVGGGDLSLGLQLTRHPGHNPDADTRAFTWLRFKKSF